MARTQIKKRVLIDQLISTVYGSPDLTESEVTQITEDLRHALVAAVGRLESHFAEVEID